MSSWLTGPSDDSLISDFDRFDRNEPGVQVERPTCDCGCGKPIHPKGEGFARECAEDIYAEEVICGYQMYLAGHGWEYHDAMMGCLLEVMLPITSMANVH